MSVHKDLGEATEQLQKSLDKIGAWAQKWKIKMNASKSTYVIFTTRRVTNTYVTIDNEIIPTADEAKYLGMHLDKKLTWKAHLTAKRKQIDLKLRKLYWLLGYKSPLSLHNKLLLYKTAIIPIWTYGIQLWGCAKKSNIDIIQRSHNKALRTITAAPWFVSNATLHNDLRIGYVNDYVKQYANSHCKRLQQHTNRLTTNLLNTEIPRRLKRNKPQDLVQDN
ncbi:hypothetical protein KPH14_011920 [Odynerus spinipes]|uniref:RNA-directed DNA polymerase n=1 Tax=Odynerus spinipes TaxID=1348599 RepID=A0AAD9VKU5_9HYME|nr:hypothetical protein KPH14_011920 [Odynerus spinipes]